MPPTPPSPRLRAALPAVIFLLVVSATVSAASLAFTRASWSDGKLDVAGTAARGAAVTLTNAATGAVVGTVKVEDNGRWKATFENLSRVPCRVRATQGGTSVERAVSGAPSTCENGSTTSLTSLAITGSAVVAESSSATYAATAGFSDGTTQNVTAAATWSENSGYASIAGGVLTTSAVTSDQTVTVGASYSTGGVTRTAVLQVTVLNAPTVSGSHATRFSAYEGTKTCLTCHMDSDGIRGTDPKTHTTGFMKGEKGTWHDDPGASCFLCHSDVNARVNGVSGQQFCGYCHN